MNPDKLVRMANDIAGFFRAYPAEQAQAGIRDHLAAFWTPRMREELDRAMASDAPGADPLVRAALRRDPAADSPAAREAQGPERLGALGSDAG